MAWHRCLTWCALMQLPGTDASPGQNSYAAMAWHRSLSWGALLQWPGTGAPLEVLCCTCLLLLACRLESGSRASAPALRCWCSAR